MQPLQLTTEHLAHSHAHSFLGDVLPSPSTFFSGGAYSYLPSPSNAAFDYQATFADYAATLNASSDSSASTPEPSWPGSGSDRSSSPATSLDHSTPRGSPVFDKAVVVGDMGASLNPFDAVMAGDALLNDDDPFSSSPMESKPILDLAPSSQHPSVLPTSSPNGSPSHSVDTCSVVAIDHDHAAMFAFAPPAPASSSQVPAAQQQQQFFGAAAQLPFDLPSPAASSYGHGQYHVEQTPSPYQQHAYVPHQQPQGQVFPPAQQGAASAGFTAGQFAAVVSDPTSLLVPQHHGQHHAQQQQQQQQQHGGYMPVQFMAINGATYAVAVPVSAPAPAAIETPHGTYYFVPNPAASTSSSAPAPASVSSSMPATPVAPPAAAVVSPAPAPAVVASPDQTPAPQQPPAKQPHRKSRSPLPVQTPIVVPAASPDQEPSFVLPTGATVPASALPVAMGTQQKIRLPVGQGKKGSTKRRPAKKEQVRRFTCPHPGCGRAFARNFNMASHYKSHLGVREFQCPVCPKMFSRRHDRARHCAAVHDEQVDREGHALLGAGDDNGDDDDDDDEFELDIGVAGASGSG